MKIDRPKWIVESSEIGLTFDDVLLQPQYSDIESRTQISLDQPDSILTLRLPIISANMDTITEDEMAIEMSNWGGAGILHRFCTPAKLAYMLQKCNDSDACRIPSVGVSKNDPMLASLDPEYIEAICIDVAHGHHKLVGEKIGEIRKRFGSLPIIAGNVATAEGTKFLLEAGADIIKVGIGGGSNCTTRVVTGHGVPQVTAITECAQIAAAYHKEIIADGGLRRISDIATALACGATYVMLGSMLAGAPETPGKIVTNSIGGKQKVYRGMASFQAQASIGKDRTPEGISRMVPLGAPVKNRLEDIVGGLQSSLSYSGCRSLEEFRRYAKFMQITSASFIEGMPHGLTQ